MISPSLRRIPSILAFSASLTATLALTGCSGSGDFESRVLQVSEEGRAFRLPDKVDGKNWDEVLVLCPYDQAPRNLDQAFVNAAADIDTNASDASQWLLFRTADDVTTLTISRSELEFCSLSHSGPSVYAQGTLWTSADKDGVAVMTPAT